MLSNLRPDRLIPNGLLSEITKVEQCSPIGNPFKIIKLKTRYNFIIL